MWNTDYLFNVCRSFSIVEVENIKIDLKARYVCFIFLQEKRDFLFNFCLYLK